MHPTVSLDKAKALSEAGIKPDNVDIGQIWYARPFSVTGDMCPVLIIGQDETGRFVFVETFGAGRKGAAFEATIKRDGTHAPTIINLFPHLPINAFYKLWGHRTDLLEGQNGLHCVTVPYVDNCGRESKKDFVDKTNPHDAAADALLWWMEYEADDHAGESGTYERHVTVTGLRRADDIPLGFNTPFPFVGTIVAVCGLIMLKCPDGTYFNLSKFAVDP